jgi:DNA-nicking Smr family endonuclease
VRIDLHGYRPSEIVWNGLLIKIVQQCWEMGETELQLIHGHGRVRGKSPG